MKRKILCFLAVLVMFCCGFFFSHQKKVNETEPTHTLRVALWDYDIVNYDKKIIEAFQQDYPDIYIDVVSYSPNYYSSSLEALLDSGERIDVFWVNQLDQYSQILARDVALPLDRFVEEYDVDLSAYPDVDVLRGEDDKLFALPYRKDKYLLYYNRDLLKKAGISDLGNMTWEEFAQTAETLTQNLEPGQYGAYFQKSKRMIPQIMRESAIDWQHDDLSIIKKELNFLGELEQQGCIPTISFCESQGCGQRSFETGNYGMFIHGTWYINYLINDQKQGMFDFDWGIAAKPTWEQDSDGWSPTQMTPVCIHKDTTEPEAAWTFLNYLCGKQGAYILANEQILPAYEDSEIRAVLEKNLTAYGIDPALVMDGFDSPVSPLSVDQQAIVNRINQKYEDALLGLYTPDEVLDEIRSIY